MSTQLEDKLDLILDEKRNVILPQNIKSGVKILGIEGTYQGTPNNQDKTITPTTSQQTITADSGYTGIGTVTVNAVTSAIDSDIQASNIKSGVNILGVEGSLTPLSGQTKTISPSTSSQTITPDTGYNGITEVTVNAVTNSIDNNIQASNIKNGVTILGVQGSFQGIDTSDANATTSDILATKTAYVNGQKITGAMTNNGALNYTPSASQQSIPAGYTSGGTIAAAEIENTDEYDDCLDLTKNILGLYDLPYIELEYIESNAQQYINTGYVHKANTKVEIKFYMSSSNTSQFIGLMGARKNAYYYNCYAFFTRFNNQSNFCYSRTGKEPTNAGMYDKWVTLTTYQGTATYTDGTNTSTITSTGTIDAGVNNFLLFNLNTGGTNAVALDSQNTNGLRIAYCKIWDDNGGTLVRNFIPVKKRGDNTICMYDKVTRNFYANAGSGSFTAGPVVEEEE